MSIDSKQLYQIIKRAAHNWLKGAGFRPFRSSGGWVKGLDENRELTLLFQADKNGWSWHGSRFTLNFALRDPGTGKGPLIDSRFGPLLEPADGEVWVALTNRVIAKLQSVEQPPLYDWEYPEDRSGPLTPVTRFSAADDPWMRFYQENDITTWWLGFLEPRMDRLIRRFFSPERDLIGHRRGPRAPERIGPERPRSDSSDGGPSPLFPDPARAGPKRNPAPTTTMGASIFSISISSTRPIARS